MARADHIRVLQPLYYHHGIDCGNGTVIHYSGGVGRKVNACVRRSTLDEFAEGQPVVAVPHEQCLPPDEVIARAESRLGEASYSLAFNNCEHFALWCKTSCHRSEQTEAAADIIAETVGRGTKAEPHLGTVKAITRAALRIIGCLVLLKRRPKQPP